MKNVILFYCALCLLVINHTQAANTPKEENNISDLEQRIFALEKQIQQSKQTKAQTNFNPELSIILDGKYASYQQDAEDYELPGFALGEEAHLAEEGFSIGHIELLASANIDDKFYGKLTLAFAEHDDEIETELEEAYIETLGLGHGFNIKAGRFFSALGYHNEQHEHAWDFADAPLIYRGLFGKTLIDDGIQIRYIVPSDLFFEIGTELSSGEKFPAGGAQNDIGAWTAFVHIGGDIKDSHSWQLGLSHWRANDIRARETGGHQHDDTTETPAFTGDSEISAIDLVYKWAPNGNYKQKNAKLQFEYLERDESGTVDLLGSTPLETSSYDGEQSGWYAQAIYQFHPHWQTGLRFGKLNSATKGNDPDALEEAGLLDKGHSSKRSSMMLEWLPSEFSRVRLQYNYDESYQSADNQVILQFTHSLGSHGAHTF